MLECENVINQITRLITMRSQPNWFEVVLLLFLFLLLLLLLLLLSLFLLLLLSLMLMLLPNCFEGVLFLLLLLSLMLMLLSLMLMFSENFRGVQEFVWHF